MNRHSDLNFGRNVRQVGYGLPSGHVQVTAAVYLLLAAAAGKRRYGCQERILIGLATARIWP